MRTAIADSDELRKARRALWTSSGLAAAAAVILASVLFIALSQPRGAYASVSRFLLPAPQHITRVSFTADHETWSNGLIVMNAWRAPSKPRVRYPVFPAAGGSVPLEWRTAPAGIVYHSTESHPLAMDAEWKPDLPPIEQYLLDYVRAGHLYHFVIDRTGRVFRVVPEGDIANHAGKSVWGDERRVYVNLNASFLGIAFEREARDSSARITQDQIQSARLLTDMLRAEYGIAAGNCVTHAQVSVNPDSMILGAHTDWASDFPFAELGLDDNYAQPPASMLAFGFDYDRTLVAASGNRPWEGLVAAHRQVRSRAGTLGLSVARYRATLARRYRAIVAQADVAPDAFTSR